ncbi:MAG: sigma-70 family RNA polymerase sigma factor [Kordiimonadaceae bacterium]|nr:sigma-70 family RNA polymerase sigma factor [Kordiimonadaceae bacterium]
MQQDNNTESDETLVSRVGAGDRQAFGVLAARYGMRYRMLAYRFTKNMAQAEDLAQEAFVKLWTHADRFDAGKAKFTTWFHRLVVNRCLDEKRKRHYEALPASFDKVDPALSAEAVLGQADDSRKLSVAVGTLSERQKTAVTLSYFEGLSNQEAADVMDLNIKAYESLLVRSRAKMRQVLMAEKDELLAALG